jgi:hypothetical protein
LKFLHQRAQKVELDGKNRQPHRAAFQTLNLEEISDNIQHLFAGVVNEANVSLKKRNFQRNGTMGRDENMMREDIGAGKNRGQRIFEVVRRSIHKFFLLFVRRFQLDCAFLHSQFQRFVQMRQSVFCLDKVADVKRRANTLLSPTVCAALKRGKTE